MLKRIYFETTGTSGSARLDVELLSSWFKTHGKAFNINWIKLIPHSRQIYAVFVNADQLNEPMEGSQTVVQMDDPRWVADNWRDSSWSGKYSIELVGDFENALIATLKDFPSAFPVFESLTFYWITVETHDFTLEFDYTILDLPLHFEHLMTDLLGDVKSVGPPLTSAGGEYYQVGSKNQVDPTP